MADTILGPYGEGYCTACRFIVGLDARGRMDVHCRGELLTSVPRKPCRGSGRRPAKRTPYASRKSRFRIRVSLGTCPSCQRRFELQRDGTLDAHTIAPWLDERCKGSNGLPHSA